MEMIRKRRIWSFVLAVFLGLAAGLGVFLLLSFMAAREEEAEVVEDEEEATEATEEAYVVKVEGKMLLTGNVFWGRKMAALENPFVGLESLGRGEYTDWIGGLECPVTDRGNNKYEEENLLKFNCDARYLPEFAKWFSVVSLGNNHTDNQGVDGFAETKERLAGAGVQYFGHYDFRDTEEVCKVIGVGVVEVLSDGSRREGRLPMGFCGYDGVFGAPTEAALSVIAEYAEVMPVVAMPHMGAEYVAKSDALRERLYRKMIDYGAEFVAGDHAHWVQNAEVYQGRLILYSMGNFMFDQIWEAEVRRSAALSAGFVVSGFEGWMGVAEECIAGGLEVCREFGLEKYGVEWEFGVVGTEMGKEDLIVRRASEEVYGGILGRLGWEELRALN